MTRPVALFDSPLAALVPDPQGARMYGNVDNRMDVNLGVRHYLVAVAVPTELFTFMLEVARVPVETRVHIAIDAVDGFFVFSLLAGDSLYDMWVYSEKSLPAWILNRGYQLVS